jgi:hypothetical protein
MKTFKLFREEFKKPYMDVTEPRDHRPKWSTSEWETGVKSKQKPSEKRNMQHELTRLTNHANEATEDLNDKGYDGRELRKDRWAHYSARDLHVDTARAYYQEMQKAKKHGATDLDHYQKMIDHHMKHAEKHDRDGDKISNRL